MTTLGPHAQSDLLDINQQRLLVLIQAEARSEHLNQRERLTAHKSNSDHLRLLQYVEAWSLHAISNYQLDFFQCVNLILIWSLTTLPPLLTGNSCNWIQRLGTLYGAKNSRQCNSSFS